MEVCGTRRREILKPTRVSRQSSFKDQSTGGTPFVITVASTSAEQSALDNSIDFDALKTEIYAAYIREQLDLDRALPPTPISDSPMVSPSTPRPDKTPASRPRSRNVESASRLPASTLTRPRSLNSKYSTTISRRGRRHPRSSLAVLKSSSLAGRSISDKSAVSPLLERKG